MYRQKLVEFFNRHDPTKLELVDEIVEKFPDQQQEVFDHLTKVYTNEDIIKSAVSSQTIFAIPPKQNMGVG